MPPAQPLIPCTWLKTGPCEIIRALNSNGSPAHSLFSPGSRVPECAEGPMSDCSERTKPQSAQEQQKRAAPVSLLLCPRPRPRPPSFRTPGGSLERNPPRGCARTHRRWARGQSKGHWWRRAAVSVRESLPPPQPPSTLQGLMRAAEGGMWQEGGRGRLSDLLITHGQT